MSYFIKRHILKFGDSNEQEIVLPAGSKILKAEVFHGEIVLYSIYNRGQENMHTYHISIFTTNQLFIYDDTYDYYGSVNVKNITAHIFGKEVKEIKKRGRPQKYKTMEV